MVAEELEFKSSKQKKKKVLKKKTNIISLKDDDDAEYTYLWLESTEGWIRRGIVGKMPLFIYVFTYRKAF